MLGRVAPYMIMQKRTIIMNCFVTSQFGYCPLIWKFHNWRLNNKIVSIREKALRIIYQDHISNSQKLLHKSNLVSIHHRNLQVLARELFKIHRGLLEGQIFWERYLCPKLVCIIFVGIILLKDAKFTLLTKALNSYSF